MGTRTVLLVDADGDSRASAERLLREHGYHVLAVDNGTAGLETATRAPVDLAVVDLMLPGRNGFGVLERLKQHRPAPRVVLTSSVPGTAHRALAELLGADDYLVKPVSMNRLLEAVQRLCSLPIDRAQDLRPPAKTNSMNSHVAEP